MQWHVNCASTCANQTSGSDGQKGESFRLTAELSYWRGKKEQWKRSWMVGSGGS